MLTFGTNAVNIALSIYGEQAVLQIQENIRTKPVPRRGKFQAINQPINASGKTADSVKFHLAEGLLTITAAKHAFTAEYGRGPGPISKAGQDNLREWMAIRGIEAAAFWPIMQSIRKKGTLMYQQVKKSGLLDVFSEGPLSVQEFMRQLTDRVVGELQSDILRQWQN